MKTKHLFFSILSVIYISFTVFAPAQDKNKVDMEKAIQNPIAKIISIPFLNNIDFGIGDYNRTMNTLNFQPVIPFSLGKSVNLITRTIIPVITKPIGENESITGLSDINLSLFFSPANSGSVIWGIGPVLSFPTATDDALASKKWSAGPSVIILTQPEGWTLGLVAQNTWSYAGDETKTDVNFFYSQIFIVKNLPKGWYLNCAPIITANWKASSGNQWTVPLGIGAGKLLKFGKLPVNLQAGYYYNAVKPDGGAKWQLRGLMVFFLPNF